ncbi:MAG: hypothetical protein M1341_04715 [Candidatus Thermoplasmatota archaeon]|nr:hypothetical protein [Candidatus Thermoplasmatota archaeon]
MPKNRKLLIPAVIAVTAIVLFSSYELVILPYENRGPPTYPVTVYDNNSSTTVSGNFTSNSSANPFLFNFSANATIAENEYPNSTLTISFEQGGLFYFPAEKAVLIMANLVITGSLESNLHPSSFTIGISVSGSRGAYYLATIFGAVSGPRYPPLQNTTDYNQTDVTGYGVSGNITMSPLLNEPQWSPSSGYSQSRYNFTYNTWYRVTMFSYWGTHVFSLWTTLTGLTETPFASVTLVTENT